MPTLTTDDAETASKPGISSGEALPVGARIRFGDAVVEVKRGKVKAVSGALPEDFVWLCQQVSPAGWVDWMGDKPDQTIALRIIERYPFGKLEGNGGKPVKAYDPQQRRWPKGHPSAGQWMPEGDVELLNHIWAEIGPYSADAVTDLDSLRAFAKTADYRTEATWQARSAGEIDPIGSIDGVRIFNHAVRWSSELETIAEKGIQPRDSQVWASSELVRDRGGGVVFFHGKRLQERASVDQVSEGLAYPEYVFKSVPVENIVKVVREIPLGGGHGIREDRLARFAVGNQGLSGPDYDSLPAKYRRWFRLTGGQKAIEFEEAEHPRYPPGHPLAGQFMDKPDEAPDAPVRGVLDFRVSEYVEKPGAFRKEMQKLLAEPLAAGFHGVVYADNTGEDVEVNI